MNMTALTSDSVALKTALQARTLIVGNEENVVTSFPTLADEFLNCKNVEICGDLDKEAPADDLWRRIEISSTERLWIIGGDGTINMVGECLLQHQHALPCYLTPAGTANDLARALSEKVASDPKASSVELNPTSAQPQLMLDLLEVTLDDSTKIKCCANMFTLGSSARNTQHVTEEIKSRWGAFAYLSQVWRAIGDLEPFSIKLAVGQAEERTVENVLNLFIANGPYCGGGHRLAPPAEVDDGRFDAVIFRQGSTAGLAHVVASFLAGGHLEHELVEHFAGENLTIECSKESALTLDGESFSATRVALKVIRNFLPITLIQKQ